MKLLFLIIFLTTNFVSYSDDSFENDDKITQYFKKYWEDSNNINFKLSTYYVLEDVDTNFTIIKKIISKAISSNPDKYTIYQADVICHEYKELTKFCHSLRIHQLHYEVDPHNINTYLLDLHKSDDEEHNKKVLSNVLLTGTTFNSFNVDSILVNKNTLKELYSENPQLYTLEDGDNVYESIQDIKKEIRNNDVIQKGLIDETIDEAANNAQSLFMAMMTSAELNTSWSQLSELCLNKHYAKECNRISRIKIMSFDRIFLFGTGEFVWGIFNKSSKSLDLDESVVKSFKVSFEKLDNSIDCYLEPTDVENSVLFNNFLASQYFLNIQQHGELEASKRLSFSVYNKLIKNGFKPDFNPNDCE